LIRPRGSNGRRDALLLAITAATVWVCGPGGAGPARAEPAFAVRTGYSCGQCHVNRTGGGMRTAFGSLYTQTVLPARVLRWRDEANLLPANPDARLGFGGDVRAAYLGINSEDFEDTSSFEIPQANAFAELRLAPGKLSVYFDQEVGPGASASRELFGLLSFRDRLGYVKVGKFIPPYGWALPDNDAFIREPLGFAFTAPDVGVEAGFEPGNWSMHLAVINGNAATRDDDRTKKFVLRMTRRFRHGTIGMSGANDLSGGTTTTWGGFLGGLHFGRVSLLGEGDWRRAGPDKASEVDTWAGFFEANLLIKRGMNVKYAHDWIDPNRDERTDQRHRDSLGFEYVPYPFVQLRLFARLRDGPRRVLGSRDEQIDLEVHLFF
jgi:hypothetical protein